MNTGLPALLVALVCGQSPEASFQTPNFVVKASNPEIAKLVAESAENSRKNLAKLWLETEPADWLVPCQINVTVGLDRSSGRTDVSFSKSKVLAQTIEIKGPLDRVLKGPLPHELTHVLFAHYFGIQPPRWADEGGAILSEDAVQGNRQNNVLNKLIAEERCFSLRRLINMQQYPADISSLYAQGYSLSRFLVAQKSRRVFLDFVRQGTTNGWDDAVRSHYGYDNVEKLEQAWLGSISKEPVTSAKLASPVFRGKTEIPAMARPELSNRPVN